MARRCRLGGALNAVFDGIQHKLSKVLWMDDPFAKPPVNYNPIGFVGNLVIQEPIPIIQGSYKRLLPNLAKVQIYKQAGSYAWDSLQEFLEQKGERFQIGE